MAKSDTMKVRSPQIGVTWKGDVPEAVYFERDEYRVVAKVEAGKFVLSRRGWDEDPTGEEGIVVSEEDTLRLMESLKVKNPDTLIRALGRRFALKEPHNCFGKILTSLQRRGIPYERV